MTFTRDTRALSLSLPRENTASRQPSASQEGVLTRTSLCLDLQPPGLWKIKVCCISYAAYDILLWQPEQTATGISKHHTDSGIGVPDSPAWAQDTGCSLPRPPNVQLRPESVTVMQVLPPLPAVHKQGIMELGAFIYKQENTTTHQ